MASIELVAGQYTGYTCLRAVTSVARLIWTYSFWLLIDCGISTPYELHTSAGLSPGASIPALQRLTEGRFIRPGRPGSRGRIEHQLTRAGKNLLKTGWQELIEPGPTGSLDSDVRVALLALANGEPKAAKQFLEKSARRKLAAIATIKRPEESDSLPPLAFLYLELRSRSAKVLLKAEASAAIALAQALPQKLNKMGRSKRLKRSREKRPEGVPKGYGGL